MLSKFGTTNLEILKDILQKKWAKKALITDIKVMNRPFDMFEMYVTINNRYNIKISYDRSIVDISVQINGEYIWLTDLTDQDVVEGFESCQPENLLYNFKILDGVLQAM